MKSAFPHYVKDFTMPLEVDGRLRLCGETRTSSFPLNAQLRIKHGRLLDAANKIGGVRQLAERIGVHATTVYQWCSLTGCPPESPTHFWPPERLEKLERDLFELTGCLLVDLFPRQLRERVATKAGAIVFERRLEVEADALQQIGSSAVQRLIAPDPSEVLEKKDFDETLKAKLKTLLKHLSSRERQIIEMRFGLGGEGYTWTYEEIAAVFKVTKERIRQIEARALNRMRGPTHSESLVGLLD